MINVFVGVTDYDWFRFLSGFQNLDEINFWQPSGQQVFRALRPGELFLFKLHSPRNFVVGGGVFSHATVLPVSLAWEAFGQENGAPTLEEMKRRIARYRKEAFDPHRDYSIGCRILLRPFFLPEDQWIPVPASWAPNIVVGKRFDTAETDGKALWDSVAPRLELVAPPPGMAEPAAVPAGGGGERFGAPQIIQPRLGQGAFRIQVTDAYERRCAVTGERTLPILDAAHIQGYAEGGEHRVDNGLLLRTDIHKLFDLGYVTVTDDARFEVSNRLREDFENGKYYYGYHGSALRLPARAELRPSHQFLEWHQSERFKG